MIDHVTVISPEGPIAEIRLSRPDKKNALTLEMLDGIALIAGRLAKEPGLRAVLLSGEGDDFGAGLDTSVLMGMAGNLDALRDEVRSIDEAGANRFQRPAKALAALPVPVIAAIDGVCFGAAMQLALAADIRVASPNADLSIMETKWGLIPDMGISISLPRLMGPDRAKWLIMTAARLSGAEAIAAGLVTRVADDPLAEARAMAEALAERSPDAMRASKALVDGIWNAPLEVSLKLEADLQLALIGAPNQVETVMANMQKRSPRYR